MSEYLMVEVSPQLSVMFKDNKPVRVFININNASEEVNGLIETAKEMLSKTK